MRITDVFLSFPSLLMAIVIAAFLGPSPAERHHRLRDLLVAVVHEDHPGFSDLDPRTAVRTSSPVNRHLRPKIVAGHILPNCIGPIIVQASLDFGSVVLISALSFLGLGAQAPTPEWGLMINTSRNYFLSAWWYIIFPGIGIMITVLAFNLLGDGLREVLDPRTRKY